MDESPLGAAIDRLAQAADVHVDEIALRIEVQVPDALEQHRPRDHLPLPPHEELEQLLLARGELDLAAGPRDLAGEQVEFQVRYPQHRRLGGARMPAQQRLDARQQLRERKRLGEIVVAARLEAADAIVDRAEGAQDQYRRREPRPPQLLNDRQPIDVGQHAVGDDQVELAREGAGEPLTPVGGVIDRVAALAQSLDEDPRGLGIVLDEQDVHGPECTAEWFEALDPGSCPAQRAASKKRGFCSRLRHLRRRGTSLSLDSDGFSRRWNGAAAALRPAAAR